MMALPDEGISEIYELLYRLGLTGNYTGFFYLSYAIWLAEREPDRLLLVTKWLYPDIAKRYSTGRKAVERGIRYSILLIWTANAPLLQSIIGLPLCEKPRAASFIAMLSRYIAAQRTT